MPAPTDFRRRTVIALVAYLIFVLLAIVLVDRAASTWSYSHLHRPTLLVWFTHLVDPLQPLAILGLLITGVMALCGWRPGRHGRALILACLAILVSVAIKEQLKYLCGRTWPETWVNGNPSWIRDGVFGFFWLHGGQGWASFPSGHTTQMAALSTVAWLKYPVARWLAVVLVLLVAVGLWGSDFHYVGDILAGALLGWSCGYGLVALAKRSPDAATPKA